MNYLYINAGRIENFQKYFINQTPKSVEQIYADGEMGHYFQRFMEDDGYQPFRSYSGRWSQSLLGWSKAAEKSGGAIIIIGYETIIEKTEGSLRRFSELTWLSILTLSHLD